MGDATTPDGYSSVDEPQQQPSRGFDFWVWLGRVWRKTEESCEEAFQLSDRGTTLEVELYAGLVNFFSCLYILPVVSRQMEAAGYVRNVEVMATATVCGIGCILSSYPTNLPFVVAPPTSVTIFLSVSMQRGALTRQQGNTAVALSGLLLVFVGIFRTAARFLSRLIPDCIQASTAVGIGLITSLAGAIEVGLVVHGSYTLLAMGEVTPALVIAGIALVTIAVAQHYHLGGGAFVIGLGVGSVLYWSLPFASGGDADWPAVLSALPTFDLSAAPSLSAALDMHTLHLVGNLFFLFVLTLNGLARSLSDLAGLTYATGAIPRGNWLYIFCGITTIVSGCLGGPPLLISPESAAGIKAGAKTGLSTLVCGLLFGVATCFAPFFAQIPAAGTSPLLLVVGMVLFQNVGRIQWAQSREAVSAFIVLLLIPFTYSIVSGIWVGYLVFLCVGACTGEAWADLRRLLAEGGYSQIGSSLGLGLGLGVEGAAVVGGGEGEGEDKGEGGVTGRGIGIAISLSPPRGAAAAAAAAVAAAGSGGAGAGVIWGRAGTEDSWGTATATATGASPPGSSGARRRLPSPVAAFGSASGGNGGGGGGGGGGRGRRASWAGGWGLGEGGSERRRAGSLVDRIPMDLDHSAEPMIS